MNFAFRLLFIPLPRFINTTLNERNFLWKLSPYSLMRDLCSPFVLLHLSVKSTSLLLSEQMANEIKRKPYWIRDSLSYFRSCFANRYSTSSYWLIEAYRWWIRARELAESTWIITLYYLVQINRAQALYPFLHFSLYIHNLCKKIQCNVVHLEI